MKAKIVNKRVMTESPVVCVGDKNSTKITFEIPCVIEGINLENSPVYIKAENSLGGKIKKRLTAVKSGDNLLIEWLLGSEECAVSGDLRCQIVFEFSSGEIVLNTKTFVLEIQSSVKTSGPKVNAEYNQIIQMQNQLATLLEDGFVKPGDNLSSLENDLGYIVEDDAKEIFQTKIEELLPLLTNADEGKILEADANGKWVLSESLNNLKEEVAHLAYIPVSLISFTNDVTVAEKGDCVNNVNFTWELSKDPIKIIFEGEILPNDSRLKALTGLNLTQDKSWQLTAIGQKDESCSRTSSVSFLNGVYYGAKSIPDSYDSQFILTLTKELSNDKIPTVTVEAGENEFVFYCLPENMGSCAFKVHGITGGFELVDTVLFTNSKGYSEKYYIYKSDNANLGKVTVSIE